ncbi:Accessory gene regulator B [Alkaliphilus metalliredigens QYMF]|uniref:Accessory gene regulator B n=1 Tax=Alkaliphilus metalliredigens (strain QYMF) TaxID=293826 RepID=A6TJH3_ALKMQ|nr:accessory gene regulator B family protein [Alkaliphilus metalliredigens]ABR46341.1 Accessory gene regulator B [Alkaliphilus metalliredigens QYMF]
MHSLIDIFAYKIYKEKLLSHADIRKMKYAMTVIWNEIVKFIILLIIFSVLDKRNLFLFSLCLLLPIRTFSGGLHFKSSFICFVTSLMFFLLSVVILPNLFTMNINLTIIFITVSILIIYIYSPIPSSFRPILDKKRKRFLKYLSVFFTILSTFILFTFALTYNKAFFECGIWTICMQAFQLMLGKELK